MPSSVISCSGTVCNFIPTVKVIVGDWVTNDDDECTSFSVSRLEQTKEDESKDALKDLVNLVTCLTTYGVMELKPAGLTTGAPFLLPGFVLPQPSGKGVSV